MTSAVHRSEKARHLVIRMDAGERLPESLTAVLGQERVKAAWIRANGVLRDVKLRAYDSDLGSPGVSRRFAGPVQALVLEGTIGIPDGEPATVRGLFARETDRGLETFGGEIVEAIAVAVHVLVIALDVAGPASEWSQALEASESGPNEPAPQRPVAPVATPSAGATPPSRPPRPARAVEEIDSVYPEAGDVVDHFAFGRCDVLRSDGDRLHLKVHKDSRIREIALEMLRVSRLEDTSEGKRSFKLERRM
jgi:predicted DNA-binding protein with PD1-like motif